MEYLINGWFGALALLADMDDATLSAIHATLLSTIYAMAAAFLLGLVPGFILGYYNFPGKRALRLVSDTLLAFPTVLIGLIVYAFITARGPLGEYGLLFTLPGMAIGQAVLALPIVISWTAQAVENLDPRCRETLLTLGANARQTALLTFCHRHGLCHGLWARHYRSRRRHDARRQYPLLHPDHDDGHRA